MRKFTTLTLVGALVLGAQAVQAKSATKDIPIDRNFLEREVTWTNTEGGMDIRWAMMRMEGRLWVCGAVRHKNRASFVHNRKVLRKGWVKRGSLKGKKVMHNLIFFNEIKPRKKFAGKMATCKDTGQKPDTSQYYMNFDPHMANF